MDVGREVLLDQTQMELQLGVGVGVGQSDLIDVLFQVKVQGYAQYVSLIVLRRFVVKHLRRRQSFP